MLKETACLPVVFGTSTDFLVCLFVCLSVIIITSTNDCYDDDFPSSFDTPYYPYACNNSKEDSIGSAVCDIMSRAGFSASGVGTMSATNLSLLLTIISKPWIGIYR